MTETAAPGKAGSKSANFALVHNKIITVEKTDSLISIEDREEEDLNLPSYEEPTESER